MVNMLLLVLNIHGYLLSALLVVTLDMLLLHVPKKKKKVWVPKGPRNGQVKKTSPMIKKTPLNRIISKPDGGSKPKSKMDRIRLLNSFDVIGNLEKEMEEDKEVRMRTPTTFLEVFEKAVSFRDKGKGNLNASPVDRPISPPCVI
jgi:hypothetical protein